MAQRSGSYQHDLPPPPPTHQQQGQQAHNSSQYQQDRRPSQQHYQQPSQASASAQASQVQPPPSSHSKSKSRSFSFHSDKNKEHKRSGSKSDDHHESTADKEALRIHSKADPTLAMSEVEPSMEAAMTHSQLAPLRSIQHHDTFGNPIADPDKSNPTRNRWERPLDTIRSFEAAIDGNYRRKSTAKPDVDPVSNWNRRSILTGSQLDGLVDGGRHMSRPGSYYGGQSRPASHVRPDMRGMHTARSSTYGDPRAYNDGGHMDYGPVPSRQRMSRMHTEPMHAPQPSFGSYHLQHKDRSYETVTSAAEGSRNSDQIGYQTDPTSSDNSSIERRSPAKRQEPVNDYGIGFGQSQPYNNLTGLSNPNQAPAPPQHATRQQQNGRQGVVRKEAPSLLKRQSTQNAPQTAETSPPTEKRKSWLMRRFSKKE